MPWGIQRVETIRKKFVAKVLVGEESISELCRQYQISRPTAYKWLERSKLGDSLSDRSHAPISKPHKTPQRQEEQILELRAEHPTWGARKLRRYLTDKGITDLPAVSTISDILKRNNCIEPEESIAHTPYKRFEKEHPNQLWQMDFKGHFEMLDTHRCHPLTILDDHSRFSLCIDAKANERWNGVETSLLRVFSEFGLPKAILSDNGTPWGDSKGGYTAFELWMMQLNVLPIHGRPLHPQTQGKEERFHRTMKEDLLKRTAIKDMVHAQEEFNTFRYCYNVERPHGALNLDTPAKHYKRSKISLPTKIHEPVYENQRQLRKVNCKGYVSIDWHRYYLSEAFANKYLELIDENDDCISLCYGNFKIAKISLPDRLFVSRKIFPR